MIKYLEASSRQGHRNLICHPIDLAKDNVTLCWINAQLQHPGCCGQHALLIVGAKDNVAPGANLGYVLHHVLSNSGNEI